MPGPCCSQALPHAQPELTTSYRPVTRTEVRREAVALDVPVTVQRQVVSDEGSYQMVWVAKPVARTISETHVQRQVQFRDVPRQVVEYVPQVRGQMPPSPTAHNPGGGPTIASAPATYTPKAQPLADATPGEWKQVPKRSTQKPSDVELQSYETRTSVSARGMFSPVSHQDSALRISRAF